MNPETQLLLVSARARLTSAAEQRLAQMAAAPLDWTEIERLALKHGLVTLLCRHLQHCAPEASSPLVWQRLLDYKTQNAWRALQLTGELGELLAQLTRRGIPALVYKGPVLAQMLYGDIASRQFNDIDILVRPEDVAPAVTLLEQRGYRNKYQLTPRQSRHFLRNECEYDFHHPATGFRVDLHWNLAPRYFSLRLDPGGFFQRAQTLPLNGFNCQTFAPADTLLLLAINAAKDYWPRLLPLCDIAELLRQTPELDWPQLWQRAAEARAQRMLGISLALAQELLDAPLPASAQQKLASDKALPKLVAHIKTNIFGAGIKPLTLQSYLWPARALPNRRTQLKFYLQFGLLPSFEDWNFVTLPPRADFLYYLTRPLRLAKKYARPPVQ